MGKICSFIRKDECGKFRREGCVRNHEKRLLAGAAGNAFAFRGVQKMPMNVYKGNPNDIIERLG